MTRRTPSPLPPREPLRREDLRLSVILPVLSETDSVRDIVAWLLAELGPTLEEILIIASPRSSDASRAACEDLAAQHPRVALHIQRENPGLGRAVREGYALAGGDAILTLDADGEMELATVPRLIDAMVETGADLVVASRWLPGGGFSGYPQGKLVLNRAFQAVFRRLYRTDLHDLTYGFKLMRRELAHGIVWESVFHEIGVETTVKPLRLGARVTEVASRWEARRAGETKNTFLRTLRYVALAGQVLVSGASTHPAPVDP